MITRALCTSAVVALSIACFLGAGPAPAGLNSPAIILLVGATLVWFAWPAGYSYRNGELARRWRCLITIGGEPLFKAMEDRGDSGETGS